MKTNSMCALVGAFVLFMLAFPASLFAGVVTSCGTVIVAPGTWTVANNLTCAGLGVQIATNNVTLRLDGFTITGPGTGGGTGVLVISTAGTGVSNARILGPGTITSFSAGIAFLGTAGGSAVGITLNGNGDGLVADFAAGVQCKSLLITQNTITQNAANGIRGSAINTSTIVGNNTSNNGASGAGSGIWLAQAASDMAQGNISNGNTTNGIRLGGAGGNGATGINVVGNQTNNNGQFGIGLENPTVSDSLSGNFAFGNAVFDIDDVNPGCGSNHYKSDVFGTKNQPCIA